MITVISGTNRPESYTSIVAEFYAKLLKSAYDGPINFLDLSKVANDFFSTKMYSPSNQTANLVQIQNQCIIPASKFVFVVPEYNGSIPGALKLFIDAISIREYKPSFLNKKACLVGVSSGRAGNIIGLGHLKDTLNHIGVNTMPSILPISSIETVMLGGGINIETQKAIQVQVKNFISF